MTRFSVCMPFHENPKMLIEHYGVMCELPPYVRDNVEYLICDDSSDTPPAFPELDNVRVRLFRIPPPHVPWSHRCASNIAAHHAAGRYLILTDIDHVIDAAAWAALFSIDWFAEDKVYTFKRRNTDGAEYKPHPDSWLMSRAMWERIGGYDTRYRGHYGQNYAFIERIRQHCRKPEELGVYLTRYSREDILDASERVLPRKSDEARAAVASLRRQFQRDGSFLEHGEIVPHLELKP